MPDSPYSHTSPWPRVPLCEVAVANPETLGTSTDRGLMFGYIDLSSVSGGQISWSTVSDQVFATAPSRARRKVRFGDVLFGTVRPSNRSHGYIPQQSRELVASTGFTILRAITEAAQSRFLFHFVLSDDVASQARRTEVGSGYPAVNESDVAHFEIPLVPLPDNAASLRSSTLSTRPSARPSR
jgi:type I restriction enzyme S subunit